MMCQFKRMPGKHTSQEHGHVRVVAAGVHLAGVSTLVLGLHLFLRGSTSISMPQ